MEALRLAKKSVETISQYGFKAFFQKTKYYFQAKRQKHAMKESINNNSNERDYIFADVLFINGCYLPHPSRYRVSHQREMTMLSRTA